MATYQKFEQYTEDLAHGVHNLGTGALTVALCAAANAPSLSASAVLADLTQIAYTNLSARVFTTTSSTQTAGVYKLALTDLVLTASGAVAPFRYVVLFNDTPTSPADPLIAMWDYGSDLTLADTETLTLDASEAAGVLTIT